MINYKCLYESKDELGESPVWVEEENSIYWVDIKRFLIHKLNIINFDKKIWEFDEPITCLAHYNKKIFVAGTKSGFKFINLRNNELKFIIDPEKNLANNRFNDGKCDNKGRFYAGTMNENNLEPTGCFYILYEDLSFKKIDEGYIITNGPAFSPDYKKIYLTDSVKGKIFVSNINENGSFNEKKLFISISPDQGKPDGMTVDEEGFLWVALFGGSCVNRYSIDGKKVDEIKLPASCITSCTFGGSDLSTLFITSSAFKLTVEEKNKEPLAGSLFSAKLKVKGKKTNKFKFFKNNIFNN